MMSSTSLSAQIAEMETNDWVAPDSKGLNFFEVDNSLQDLMISKLYLLDFLQNKNTKQQFIVDL